MSSALDTSRTESLIRFSLAVPMIAGIGWSLIECLDLQLSRGLGVSSARHVLIFWLTHIAIGLAACLVLLTFLTGATALLSSVVGRAVRNQERATVIATMLILFFGHVAIWLVACALGLFERSNKVLPFIGGPLLCALAAWMFRHHFTDRYRRSRPGASRIPSRSDILRSAFCFASVALAHGLNRLALPKQYFLFHVAATLFALTAALLGVGSLLPPTTPKPSSRAHMSLVIAIVGGVLVAPFGLFSISNDVRHALFNSAFDAKGLIYLARKLPGARSKLASIDLATHRSVVGPPDPLPEAAAFKQVNRVLLISIDTLRFDHLSAYGYRRETAPFIKAFSQQATTFESAWAEGPATYFAVAALLGQHLQPESLPGAIHASGRRQSAISTFRLGFAVDHAWLASAFDKVITIQNEDDLEVAEAARAEIDAGRFFDFMWIHFMAPHDPYQRRDRNPFGNAEIDRYDREILESDRGVGKVLQALDRAGLAATTAVIICSDHGEEFGEHGGDKHGTDVFSEVLRIPLMIRVPGLRPQRSSVNVSQQDLPLTIAQFLGNVPLRTTGFSRSLVPLLSGGDFDHDRAIFVPPFSTFMLGSVIWRQWKLNFSLFNGSYALFNLETDPGETANLFEAQPAMATKMLSLLTRPSNEAGNRK
jgi:hypothetical protein